MSDVVGAPRMSSTATMRTAAMQAALVAAALLAGFLLAMPFAPSPGHVLEGAWDGAFGSPYAIGASLNRATVLALVGLGFCWAYRCRLINVGGEGQIAIGGICATAVALHGGAAHLSAPWSVLYPVIAAALGGFAWGGIAGMMKAKLGTNEVISTLMLSFIALWILYAVTHSPEWLRQPMTSSTALPESPEIPVAMRLPTVMRGSPLHAGWLAVPLGVVLLWIALERSTLGVLLRAVGFNERGARHFGIRAGLHLSLSLAIAGAFAGIAGAAMILGEQHNLKGEFSSGYGFDGLVVGLLARGSPIAVIPYALFFGFLRSAGISLEIMARVPSSVVVLLQGVIVVLVAASMRERAR